MAYRPQHRKPYAILYRSKPDKNGQRLYGDEWIVFRRYRSEGAREDAMHGLINGSPYHEFMKEEVDE